MGRGRCSGMRMGLKAMDRKSEAIKKVQAGLSS